jgi:2,3-bisphosphoglycerate-dependent phosphoglycerate mutase
MLRMQTSSPPLRWPERLWVVRHGQSSGNVARDQADAAGLHKIDIAQRDADVPLSALGEEQAEALGRWFAELPRDGRPEVVLCSPFVRARQTAERIAAAVGLDVCTFTVDERLREKEFGVLDRLTTAGIAALHPEQAEFRQRLGKFYYRPPGGESWCDVILRLRSALDTLSLHHAGRRVLIVSHQVVVLCLRYLLETLDEAAILAIDKQGDVANCAVTEYALDEPTRCLKLHRYNHVGPLLEAHAPVTREPDLRVAAR